MDLLTGDMLQRYLLATAVTFGLLALLGWLAARFGPNAGVQLGHRLGLSLKERFKGTSQPASASVLNLFKNSPAGAATGPRLRRLDSLPLTPQHQLHKVQDGLRTYLFTTHPQGITLFASNLENPHAPYAEADDMSAPVNYAAPRPKTADDTPNPMLLARSRSRR